jgi:hypothetical protein
MAQPRDGELSGTHHHCGVSAHWIMACPDGIGSIDPLTASCSGTAEQWLIVSPDLGTPRIGTGYRQALAVATPGAGGIEIVGSLWAEPDGAIPGA